MTKKNTLGPLSFATTAVHAGEFVDPVTRASSPNLVMSATFAPEKLTGFSARDQDESTEGFVYARVGSPTVRQLEEKVAALEGGETALCFASGVGAGHALICGRLSAGDHLLMPESNYVGIAELARDTLPRFGIEASYVDTSDVEAVTAAIRPNTRMLWIESPSNPSMMLSDIAALSALARAKGVRDVVVDSTYCTPLATRPLELGADFVMHSLTKYIGGHGDAMGGCVIGRKADMAALNLEAMVHFGGIMSPFNAWLILRGAATLPLRMAAHEKAALFLAQKLEAHPAVKNVLYPGLPSHPQHDLAKRQMKNFSGMMTFQTHEAGPAIAQRMIDTLEITHYAVSLGHHRSLICWIGTDDIEKSTFRHGPEAAARYRALAGDGVFRLSVGIEDGEDLWADLVRCL
ncbi:trans-sulfuration enzyme family protein [Aestuariivirga litoralis]|uniref:trans-sulfuration enzyme family protein n=1 Tax=Aestuariivirga litoralis TaxID=2650924 RepID=UPI0018C6A6E6|nr:PLP-dependent aspartate aminotransferase family protein [Aestuariivirga litoralis]MBG1233645.1 PLP-dependent transferase [Aestuariivirga litoralis]